MNSIGRYIFRQIFEATVFVTIALACAVWLTQSLRYVELIVNRGLSIGLFGYLTVLLLPTFLLVILPISLFCATLFIYNKLVSDSELVVLRAAGLSNMALGRPAILLGLGVVAVCYSLSLYFLPASFRQFKDLEYTIRNDYSAILLQEGAFNSINDGLTVYVRSRESNGELLGILVHDNRDAAKPVTMMAERGALVVTDEGPRVLMIHGNRQEVQRESGQLSLLYFDRYTFDLGQFTGRLESRWRTPEERYLDELLWPDYDNEGDAYYANKLITEGHQRLVAPLYALGFVLIALASLLSGEFDRRGQTKRIAVAVGAVVVVQAAGIAIQNLAAKHMDAIPLMYLNAALPILVSGFILARGGRLRAARGLSAATDAA
ncbi:MAG: LPS export ABC transporter permease LptF [Rhodospirillaceae bacterium]|jgi:lipopolysaccharide export system permease protein|nr:LPS export ABC transporter permease LptF [Rhodospirillaceae bacterium]